ncbi:hypothetical protein HMPREF9622_01876 [Cutibacterium modestum HL037PA3]|nr:hypothetical protein HMPREF9621_02883 [Cutibacterium modestum HL037PA2]EFT15122.1 hypothetical protein HMPREF9622_01876 [Cutibacterium modestum HL037PA3]
MGLVAVIAVPPDDGVWCCSEPASLLWRHCQLQALYWQLFTVKGACPDLRLCRSTVLR